MRDFDIQGLANISWSLANIPMRHLPLRHSIAAAALQKLGECDAIQGMVNIAWA
eukprot:CAMPEP_0169297908 /NCGR_PEP_ID=MMETSP1016-20121227/66063_1 /TAXON_ID=342587 /ORGANISM="Karlodinium micrum, Strain CCMP2283" /LENGTH=53 /DNA_ID=CAMNT_0009389675 /DNA_START=17 /DNA_END=174 /DNA_ORIENTATION=-